MRHRACLAFMTTLLLSLGPFAMADDSSEAPLPPQQMTELNKSMEKLQADATQAIETNPKDVNAYSRRGDASFFLGKFDDAVADYDHMVKLDDSLANSHWRRGIALFYAGKYKDAAAQFESYHSFDQVDRENGIWRYLSQYKAHGLEKAREGLLKYEKDDREPFPSVYKLFAGTMTPEEIEEQIATAKISKDEREKRAFYAHLYIGLNYAVEGDSTAARRHLRQATLNKWGPVAGYGPNYMWHVGRLHEQLLREAAKSK
jgi:lipoprotein NlpI